MAGADGKEFEEGPQHGFGSSAPVETYEAFYRLVLVVYNYRCALTGVRFGPHGRSLHPDLDVVAIQPRQANGPLQINNYLVFEHLAARAFIAGQFLIDTNYQVIPDRSVLNNTLASKLHPSGKLLLPSEPVFWPDQRCLAHHRAHILHSK